MKKKDINEIIGRMTDLEVKMAQEIHQSMYKDKNTCLQWFDELTKITNDLDKIYKGNEKQQTGSV